MIIVEELLARCHDFLIYTYNYSLYSSKIRSRKERAYSCIREQVPPNTQTDLALKETEVGLGNKTH
jgi:hypothetical protein